MLPSEWSGSVDGAGVRGFPDSVAVLLEIVDGVECPVKWKRLRSEAEMERSGLRSRLWAVPAVLVVVDVRKLLKEGCFFGGAAPGLREAFEIALRCRLGVSRGGSRTTMIRDVRSSGPTSPCEVGRDGSRKCVPAAEPAPDVSLLEE